MTESKWATAAHIAAIIALILSGLNLYFTYFYGPNLSFQLFPDEYIGVRTFDVTKDLHFSFRLYNDGSKPAFVKYIFIYNNSDKLLTSPEFYASFTVSPQSDFVIESKEIKEINVTFHAPHKPFETSIKIDVWYEPSFNTVESKSFPIKWG